MILITQGVALGFGLLRFQRTKRVRKRPNQFEMHLLRVQFKKCPCEREFKGCSLKTTVR